MRTESTSPRELITTPVANRREPGGPSRAVYSSAITESRARIIPADICRSNCSSAANKADSSLPSRSSCTRVAESLDDPARDPSLVARLLVPSLGSANVPVLASSALQVEWLAWSSPAEDDSSSRPTSVARRVSSRVLPDEPAQKLVPVAPTKTMPLAKPRARRFPREDARSDIVDSHPARPRLVRV